MIEDIINKIEQPRDLELRIEALESLTGIAQSGSASVVSVNSKTGVVVLNSQDVGAVSITGDQTVSGLKTFIDGFEVNPSLDSGVSSFYVESGKVGINNENPSGALDVSGSSYFSQRPLVKGSGVALIGENFSNYSIYSQNFNIQPNYVAVISNSSSGITGSIFQPVSGFVLNLKNINSGILSITGAQIDSSLSGINLLKNEGVALLGVSNVGYTGWVSISQTLGF